MHSKLGRTVMLVALIAILPGIAAAGSVDIGALESSKHDDWICGEDVPLSPPSDEVSCGSAKFGECSDCADVAIKNQSSAPIKLHIRIIGSGFAPPCRGGAFALSMKCPSGADVMFGFGDYCGSSLAAGKWCIQPVQFCPGKSGESRGEVRVSVTAGSDPPKLTVFKLAGSGDYTPELAAADEARRSQLDELMKIPYVKKVVLDTRSNDTAIDVEVTEDDKIEQVRRLVPPKIEGYRTEVTTYISAGCAI